jgi:tetratricopeptide (TPR) repeat protein
MSRPGEYEVELRPGNYVLRVSRPGYQTATSKISLAASSQPLEVVATLVPVVTLLDLKVKTIPSDVELYLDGAPKGTSGADGQHVIKQLNPTQSYKLRGRKPPDYRPHEIEVPPGKTEIEITLPPAWINLKVKTIPGEAAVYLGNAYKGDSDKSGALVIERVSTTESHTIRVEKKPEYLRKIVEVTEVTADKPEITITLDPDPVVARSKSIKQQLDLGSLQEAFNTYNALSQERPDYDALPRLLDGLLQGLQTRSAAMMAQLGPYGLHVSPDELREMGQFYEQARKLRPGDSLVAAISEYWRMKSLVAAARQTSDPTSRASLLRNAAAIAPIVNTLNPQNAPVLFDSAWVQVRVGDAAAARKGFELTQRLSPNWALPPFALGLMDMSAADQGKTKQARAAGYLEAISKFTRAIEMKRDFFHAYAQRCFAYATINMHNEAVSDGLLAVAMKPQSAYAHFALGFAYFQKGKSEYRNALRNFEDALTLKEDELDEATRLSVQQKVAVVKKSLGIKS